MEPWAELPKVLTLAKEQHVAIKITGACTLSRERFPFRNIWDPVCRVIDALGSTAACGDGLDTRS